VEGRVAMFDQYFPDARLSGEAAGRLALLDGLTPGDFKAMLSRMRFAVAPSVEDLVHELETECAYRRSSSPIGFHG
jgi:hypothetical protein